MLTRVIIFGAFITGKKAFQMMKSKYEIIAFSDNCPDYYGKKMFGIPIVLPEEIPTLSADLIVIASMNHYAEIARQLINMGITDLKLFWTKTGTENYILLDVDGKEPFKHCIYKDLQIKLHNQGCCDLKRINKIKKVLIIAYYFPPAGSSPIQRTLKFVKYMREYGYEPIVLTTERDSFIERYLMDDSLMEDIPNGIQIIRIKDEFAWTSAVSYKRSQKIIEFLFSVSGSTEWMDMFLKARKTQPLYILPDKLICWASDCARYIEQYVDMDEIDLLYSTVPEWSPHLLACFFKMRYGIKWIADYRDPWVSNLDYVKLYYPQMTKEEVLLDQKLEAEITQKMDSIIVAGGKWKDDFIKNYHIVPEKIKEITNGYDEDDFTDLNVSKEKNKKFTLCYNGTIDYNRNPVPLIKVLNAMIEKNELDPKDIQWIINGVITDYYLKEFCPEDKYHITVQNGLLPHKESLQIAVNSDIMILYGERGEKGFLNYPGKFYEYLRIGRPILCFSSDQSFQANILRETGLGVNMDLYDSEGIEIFLKKQIQIWKNNKKRIAVIGKEIRKYERKNLTKLLTEEFDRVLEVM